MTLGALSMAWVSAAAALPLEWQLAGVWRDQEHPGEWQAVANSPTGPPDIEVGRGGDPVAALNRLAEALQKRRGSATGNKAT